MIAPGIVEVEPAQIKRRAIGDVRREISADELPVIKRMTVCRKSSSGVLRRHESQRRIQRGEIRTVGTEVHRQRVGSGGAVAPLFPVVAHE